MPIRTALSLPSFLTPRAWPGLRPWLVSVLATSLVFSALAAFAWRGNLHRLPDLSVFLVTIPVGMLLMVLVLAFIWRVVAGIPFAGSLTFLARALPLAWIIPLVDIIRSLGRGFALSAHPFDAAGFFHAAFSASLLPVELAAPLAIRAGIVATVLIAAFVVWFTRRSVWRAVAAGVLASLAMVKTVFFPAMLSAMPLLGVTNGYWWLNIYERFPTAVDAPAVAALRLSTAGSFVLALGAVTTICVLLMIPPIRKVLGHGFRSWSFLHAIVFVIAGGVVAALTTSAALMMQGNWWTAFLLAILLLLSLRLHFVLERCIHRVQKDRDIGACTPITEGHVSIVVARDLSVGAGAYALLAAWVLGWPVFSAIVAALAASTLSRHSLWISWPWTAIVFRSAGAASLALAGFFFMSQNARLVVPAIGIALISALYQAGAELVALKTPKS